jgi:hypothetical protein
MEYLTHTPVPRGDQDKIVQKIQQMRKENK